MPRVKGKKEHASATTLRRSAREKTSTVPVHQTPTVPVSIKKGRGRPRKTANVELKVPARRGRPPRVIKPGILTSGAKRLGRPPKTAQVAPPKRRGRPPKVVAAAGVTKEPPAPKKKRGRPSSKPAPPAAVASFAKQVNFTIDSITGTYAVECRAISADWTGGYSYDMTISIGEPDGIGRVAAALDLGYVDGTVRLSISEEDLVEWCGSNESEFEAPATPRSSSSAVGSKRDREDDEENVDSQRRSKRVKLGTKAKDSARAYRVFLRWREIDAINNTTDATHTIETHIGWLDFPHADGSVFWGVIDSPHPIGPGISIHGTRIMKKPVNLPPVWDASNAPIDPINSQPEGQAPTAVMSLDDGVLCDISRNVSGDPHPGDANSDRDNDELASA